MPACSLFAANRCTLQWQCLVNWKYLFWVLLIVKVLSYYECIVGKLLLFCKA